MNLTPRQRQRIRTALEEAMRAEDAVAAVADESAHRGDTTADAALDHAAALLRDLIQTLEPLTKG